MSPLDASVEAWIVPQQVFDQVVTHLRTQNRRASDNLGKCYYRAPNGNKCAAGCLIADDEYRPIMEGKSFKEVWTGLTLVKGLIADLQWLHDGVQIEGWEDGFKQIAADYNLIYTPKP